MGGLSSSLGFAGGSQGSGYSGPELANVVNPVTQQMTDTANGNVQTGLVNQANFLAALQAQNGVGNQSSVFNQLQGVANGTGPNPAQAALAQSTGQNVANQAAMMAGQRGSSANVGLMARQAAQVGGNIQQQAAGQGATMQANQSLNALNSMGQLATNQVGQQANATNSFSSAAQGAQSNLFNMLGGVNSANVSSQGSVNSGNAALIGQSVNNQNGYIGSLTSSGSSMMSMMAQGGAVIPQKYADGGYAYGGTQVANAPASAPTSSITANPIQLTKSSDSKGSSKTPDSSSSGQMAGGSDADALENAGTMMAADGGEVAITPDDDANQKTAASPEPAISQAIPEAATATVDAPKTMVSSDPNSGPQSSFGQAIQGIAPAQAQSYGGTQAAAAPAAAATAGITANPIAGVGSSSSSGGGGGGGMMSMMAMAAHGGRVPALVSPGERYLPPKAVEKVAKGEKKPSEVGERIPGTPKVKGNSYANDIVPKTLESGGIVIPNSVTQSKAPEKNEMKFVAATLKEQALRKGKKK